MSAAEADILRRARARISDPARWTSGCGARNADGVTVATNDPTAVRWCAVGSVQWEGYDDDEMRAIQLLHTAAFHLGGFDLVSAGTYNDKGHSFAMRLMDKAIELAEADA